MLIIHVTVSLTHLYHLFYRKTTRFTEKIHVGIEEKDIRFH